MIHIIFSASVRLDQIIDMDGGTDMDCTDCTQPDLCRPLSEEKLILFALVTAFAEKRPGVVPGGSM